MWFEEFFDKIYYETYQPFETEERNRAESEFIANVLDLPVGSRILDLGCGYGRHAVYLAKIGFKVTCFDLSSYLLSIASERAEKFGVSDRVEIIMGDMRELKFKDEFDGVYMFFTTFGYFSDKDNEKVIEGVSRALRSGGKLLLDLWNPVSIAFRAYIYNGRIDRWYEVGKYIVLESTTYDFNNGYVKAKRKFLIKDTYELVAEREFIVRFYMPWELDKLLLKYDLESIKFIGDYNNNEFNIRSPRMIIIATKK